MVPCKVLAFGKLDLYSYYHSSYAVISTGYVLKACRQLKNMKGYSHGKQCGTGALGGVC